jgi:hypothetical protein
MDSNQAWSGVGFVTSKRRWILDMPQRPTASVAIAAGCEGPLNPFRRITCLLLQRSATPSESRGRMDAL